MHSTRQDYNIDYHTQLLVVREGARPVGVYRHRAVYAVCVARRPCRLRAARSHKLCQPQRQSHTAWRWDVLSVLPEK